MIHGSPGGSQSNDLDAHSVIGSAEQVRIFQLYETLTGYDVDTHIEMRLAESVTPVGDGAAWDITLRPNLTFHDGRGVTADDILFTLERITDPASPKSMASALTDLDLKSSKVMDTRTARIVFASPFAILPELLADFKMGIVPRGYDPAKPVGAGPFKYESYEPGRKSVFTRFDGYWREGFPLLDELVILDFPDASARMNAFLSGQTHTTEGVPAADIPRVKASGSARLLESEGSTWYPMEMRSDIAPFSDVRVRQAFRLIVDRDAMVKQAWNGHARVANDYYSPFDPGVVALPQRAQDLDKAKALLKAAGHENLSIELNTSEVVAGFVEMSEVFAQQAKGVVNVSIKKIDAASFYGDNYKKYPFAMENKYNRGFLRTAQQSSISTAPYNSPHFNDPEFDRIVAQAIGTIDEAKRNDLIAQAQRIEYDRGAWMIPCFINAVDGYSSKLAGFRKNRGSTPLDEYGFSHVGFTS